LNQRGEDDRKSRWTVITEKDPIAYQKLRNCLGSIEAVELDGDKVRARNPSSQDVRQLDSALGILRNEFWAWKRIPAVFRAVRICPGPWYIRIALEASVWLIADAMLWVLGALLPLIGPTLGALHWVARGQTASFRGMLVALPILLVMYMATSIFIEALFFTGGMMYRTWRSLRNFLARKAKKS
jgi:hypothetical protein